MSIYDQFQTIIKAGRIPYLAFEHESDAGQTETLEARCQWAVCPECDGSGVTSAHLGDWTASEWAEEDPDFQDDYMAGRYDIPCPRCKGDRVVAEPILPEFLANDHERAVYAAYLEEMQEAIYHEQERAAERRAGA